MILMKGGHNCSIQLVSSNILTIVTFNNFVIITTELKS